MTYRRRTNIWEGRRYDGSRTCANRIAAENPLVRRDGALLYVPAQDEPDPKRAPIVSPKVGDWIVWEPCTNPVPFVVPAAMFRLLFEEDLTSKALRPGAAEARRADIPEAATAAPASTDEPKGAGTVTFANVSPTVPGPKINIPREPAPRRRPAAAATPPVRGGKKTARK